MNLEIMNLLELATPGGITPWIEQSAMPTPWQLMVNPHPAIFTQDSMGFHIFPVF
jgi:hypothetical protein